MPYFTITIADNLKLIFTVDKHPAELTFRYPGGDAVLTYDPASPEHLKVNVPSTLTHHVPSTPSTAAMRQMETVSTAGSPTIQFAAAFADGTRPMDP